MIEPVCRPRGEHLSVEKQQLILTNIVDEDDYKYCRDQTQNAFINILFIHILDLSSTQRL